MLYIAGEGYVTRQSGASSSSSGYHANSSSAGSSSDGNGNGSSHASESKEALVTGNARASRELLFVPCWQIQPLLQSLYHTRLPDMLIILQDTSQYSG